MRPIGIEDSNGKMIFEGDTFEITSLGELCYKKEFISKLKIDKVTCYVQERNNEVGVNLIVMFLSNGKPISRKDYYKWWKKQEKIDKETLADYMKEDLSSDYMFEVNSWTKSNSELNSLLSVEKHIIHSKLTDKEKEALLSYDLNNLKITIGGVQYPAQSSFIVELTDEAKTKVKEAHCSLYADIEDMVGDFTHVKLEVKSISLKDYEFKAYAINKDGEETWRSLEINYDKFNKYEKSLKRKLSRFNNALMFQTKNKTERELNERYWDKQRKLRMVLKRIEESNQFKEEEVVDDLFIGLTMSKNLFVFFEEKNCKIRVI